MGDVLDHGELFVSLGAWNYGPVGMSLRGEHVCVPELNSDHMLVSLSVSVFSFCPSRLNRITQNRLARVIVTSAPGVPGPK